MTVYADPETAASQTVTAVRRRVEPRDSTFVIVSQSHRYRMESMTTLRAGLQLAGGLIAEILGVPQ